MTNYALLALSTLGRCPDIVLRGAMAVAVVLAGCLSVGSVALAQEAVPVERVQTPSAGSILPFPELNFRFHCPDPPWQLAHCERQQSSVALLFGREDCTLVFRLGAEVLEKTAGRSAARVNSLARIQLQAADPEANFSVEQAWIVDGLPGLRFESLTTANNQAVFGVHWACTHYGFVYQFTLSGPASSTELIRTTACEMERRFHLIDRNCLRNRSVPDISPDHESPRYGYRVKLSGTMWRPRPEMQHTYPNIDFAAVTPLGSRFVVMPLSLMGLEIEPDAIVHGLVESFFKEGIAHEIDAARPVMLGNGLCGTQFDFERVNSGLRFRFYVRVLHGQGCAYLFAAWAPADQVQELLAVEALLDRIEFSSPQVPLDPAKLTETERRRHAMALNNIGLHYQETGRAPLSEPILRTAWALLSDPVLLGNLASACLAAGKSQEAIRLLEQRQAEEALDFDLAQTAV